MTTLDHQVSEPAVTYRKNYQAPTFFIDEVELHFDLFDDYAMVRSRLWIRRNRRHDEPAGDLFLNGDQLECVSIHCDGKALDVSRYTLSDKGVTIKQLADSHELLITTKIYPQKNTALSGLYRSRNHRS
jgi:aminopeptidase N